MATQKQLLNMSSVSHQQSTVKKHVQETKRLVLWHLSVCGFDIHEAVGDQLLARRVRESTPSQQFQLLILVMSKKLNPKKIIRNENEEGEEEERGRLP